MAIQKVGVVGCGLMGSGIAEVCARAGYTTLVRELDDGLLAKGRLRIEASMRMSCTREAFRLQASIRALDGATELCHRTWDESIKRDLL